MLPGTLLLVLIALPLWHERWIFPAAIVLALVAFGCAQAGWGLAGNFAKLWAAIFAGWAFVRLFEELSWVVLVALVIPLVDIISVYRGPTKAITEHHFHVYTAVAIAFVVPGGAAAYLGPPDVLFYALFLAAAQRFELRVVLDVDLDDRDVRADDHPRDRDPRRRAPGTAVPLLRLPRRRTPTCSGTALRRRRPATPPADRSAPCRRPISRGGVTFFGALLARSRC